MHLQIDTVHIVNFRNLEDVEFKIKPLTFLVGPNGSGKSTFLKAMKFFSYNLRQYIDGRINYEDYENSEFPQLIYNFEDFHFGSFSEIVTHNEENRVIEYKISGKLFFSNEKFKKEVTNKYTFKNKDEFIKEFFLYMMPGERLALLTNNQQFIEFQINFSFDKDGIRNFTFLDVTNNLEVIHMDRNEKNIGVFINGKRIREYISCRVQKSILESKEIKELNLQRYKNIDSLRKYLFSIVKIYELPCKILDIITSNQYFPSLRKIPQEQYILDNGKFPKNKDYDFWDFLLTEYEYIHLEQYLERYNIYINKIFSTTKSEEGNMINNNRVNNDVDVENENIEDPTTEFNFSATARRYSSEWDKFFQILENLGLAKGIFKITNKDFNVGQIKVVTMNNSVINIINESSGFIQIFPILLYANGLKEFGQEIVRKGLSIGPAIIQKSLFLYVEQPELHLHPNLQFKLPRYLINYYDYFPYDDNFTRKAYSILETHSEHLIRGVQVEIAKGNLKPEDVAIYYVDKDNKGVSSVRLLELDEDGNFTTKWPSGFLDLSSKAAYELLNAQIAKK